ncbi:hypothetical protein ACIHFE_05075 [Streptomyces sp. NPDC052396]|uniref:hypothetical protein n=1 Tax=Streptomyces sp. NPDC052396 TaxID=3365689 RepID=UPI0037D8FD00
MKKMSLRSVAVAALAASAIAFATAGPAAADGKIDWKNKQTGLCLFADSTIGALLDNCEKYPDYWYDEIWPSLGNNWMEHLNDDQVWCLDSNTRGSVYIGRCDNPRNNKNQLWSEEKWSKGWVLKNVATGRCLGSGNTEGIYTFAKTYPCNSSDDRIYWE